MSRSYKKAIIKDNFAPEKRASCRRIRRKNKSYCHRVLRDLDLAEQFPPVGNHNNYRRHYPQWGICDQWCDARWDNVEEYEKHPFTGYLDTSGWRVVYRYFNSWGEPTRPRRDFEKTLLWFDHKPWGTERDVRRNVEKKHYGARANKLWK